jgi:Acyl-CoA dehydrogenase, C-terminal domain/Acyl-CoA dehydrogenase, N-terminal domain
VHFGFDDDQLAFGDAVRAVLDKECSPEAVRAAGDASPGLLDRGVWDRLAAMGVLATLVPEDRGGLGLDERWLVLVLEEAGRAALPHPLVDTAVVAAPLLGADAGMVATNLGGPHVACAADADQLLLHDPGDGGLHLVQRSDAVLTPVATVDRTRRAATVTWDPSAPAPADPTSTWHPSPAPIPSLSASGSTPDAREEAAWDPTRAAHPGEAARAAGPNAGAAAWDPTRAAHPGDGEAAWDPGLGFDAGAGDHRGSAEDDDDLAWGRGSWDLGAATLVTDDPAVVELARDRGAWGTAAMLIGLGRRMVELAIAHVSERHQFGVPVGSFQAVKHQLADAHKDLAFARPVVHRAAHSLATGAATRGRDVSMAKALAGDAAWRAGRVALQCHGAIGYTVEHDLHLYLKRTWALAKAYGDAGWHRDRVGREIGI